MAGRSRIAGITIEIGGDTTKLSKALSEVNKDIKTTQAELKDVNKLLKLDPKNVELLTQKQKSLKDAVEGTKNKLQQLKDAQSQVEKGTTQWDALQREIIDTEQQLKSLEKEYKNFGSVSTQQVKAAGEQVKQVGDTMQQVGKGLTTYVTMPIMAAGAAGVASFAEVDKTMQLTNKTMGNTQEQARLLDEAMKSAAGNSVYGMNEAAEATLNFARAGLTAEEAAAALAPAMNLAAGEGGNLDTVSSGLVATINGFGDSFDQTSHYADVFAAACNNSALDVNSLSNAMSVAAPIFAASGKSVEDAALFMGIMANNGIDANTAANSLKTGLARLASDSKEVTEAMDALGINIYNADGTMKDSVVVQQELHDAFATLSEQEQLAAASAIFGKNQMAPWLALINTAPEDVDNLALSLSTATGTTDEMSTAMMEGFGGSIEQLKSSLDVLMYSLGKIVAEYIQPLIDHIQGLVDKFNSLDEGTKNLIVTIAGIVAVVGPVLLILGKIVTTVGLFMTVFPGAGAAIAAISGPVGIAIAAFAGLVAGGVLLYKNWDTIKEKAGEVASDVQQDFDDLGAGLRSGWEDLKRGGSETWSTISSNASTAWEDLKSKADEDWQKICGNISEAVAGAKETVSQNWEDMKSDAGRIFGGIYETISGKFEEAWNFVSGIVEKLKGIFDFDWSLPKPKLPHINWYWEEVAGGLLSVPHFNIDWYKKAYDNPVMFTRPTVLQTPYGLKGFGDGSGGEVVLSDKKLAQIAGSGASYTVNVYTQPGQDARQIAEEVQRELVQMQKEREAAYA